MPLVNKLTFYFVVMITFLIGCASSTMEKTTNNPEQQDQTQTQNKYQATTRTKADSLIVRLNETVLLGGDTSHPRGKPYSEAAWIQFIDARNALQNLGIAFSWNSDKYVLDVYDPLKLMAEFNYLVKAAGDSEHTPVGMASTGESIVQFESLKKTLAAYGIKYHWDDASKKYVMD